MSLRPGSVHLHALRSFSKLHVKRPPWPETNRQDMVMRCCSTGQAVALVGVPAIHHGDQIDSMGMYGNGDAIDICA